MYRLGNLLTVIGLALAGISSLNAASTEPPPQVAFQTLCDFPSDLIPNSGLTLGRDGNFYGVCLAGGTYGHGLLYRFSPAGVFTVVYNFPNIENSGFDTNITGSDPIGDLAAGPDGFIYGIARSGGALGGGTIFSYSPEGLLQPVLNLSLDLFSASNTVKITNEGELYGSSFSGGRLSHGTLYTSAGGSFSRLYIWPFIEGSSAETPSEPTWFSQGSDGKFYGLSAKGGPREANYGTFFEYDPATSAITVKYQFGPDTIGNPYNLVEGSDGYFYTFVDANSLLRVSKNAEFSTIPLSGDSLLVTPYTLIRASDGNFYGATDAGGDFNAGSVFRMTTEGVVTIIYHFALEYSGTPHYLRTPLVEGNDGYLYAAAARQGVPASAEARSQEAKGKGGSKPPTPPKEPSAKAFRVQYAKVAPSTNLPPMAREDSVLLSSLVKPKNNPLGFPELEIDVLKNDRDANKGDVLKVASTSTPLHGTVSINPTTKRIKYVSKTVTPESDDFSYTVEDGKGGTSSAYVLIRPPVQGNYSGTLGNPAVTVTASVSNGRDVNGKLTIDKKAYSFGAKFNSLDTAAAKIKLDKYSGIVVEVALEPLPAGWDLAMRVSGAAGSHTGTCSLVVKPGGKK